MTQEIDIVNRACQFLGTRTNVTATELANAFAGQPSGPYTQPCSNEAINAALIMRKLRDELNRMAPWDFAQKFANLVYICSLPTTPENASASAPFWQPGIPAPPWVYEYQYPVDCLRARKIIPQYTSVQGVGTPIYPAGTSTGASTMGWGGPALKFKIQNDSFFGATNATIATPGTGYAFGDILTLQQPTYTFQQNSAPVNQPPAYTTYTMTVGAPAQIEVTGVGAGGAITSVGVVNQVGGETEEVQSPIGGSYFSVPLGPQSVSASASNLNPGLPSNGTGATFNLTIAAMAPQRVVLCNQEQAILCYNMQVTDPNVMDDLFQDAWVHILGARLVFQLAGDKTLANTLIGLTNNMVMEARKADGNEGITTNNVTPDFIRIRGGAGVGPNFEFSPNMDFDWGDLYSPY